LDYGRRTPGTKAAEGNFRSFCSSGIPNPMVTILRQQDSLRLTSAQADSIASMNLRFTYRVDSLCTTVARYLAALPAQYEDDDAYGRYVRARRSHIELLIQTVPLVRELLTPDQRRKLPPGVTNTLDPRYLMSIRNGT